MDLVHGKPIRWGVLWDDGKHVPPSGPSMRSDAREPGVVIPSPACRRALETVVSELKGRGHEVVDMYARQFKLINSIMLTRLTPLSDPPSPYEGLRLGAQLILAEGGTSKKYAMSGRH